MNISRTVDASVVPVTVVSGATGGIGRAIADARQSDRLVLLGRNPDELAKLAREHPDASVQEVDYSSEEAVAKSFVGLDRIDRLVHCTGAITRAAVGDLSLESVTEMMEANFLVPMTVTQAALPLLRSVNGIVVFLSSGSAKRVRPGWTGYAASKYAARALAEGIGVDEPDIRVVSVYCGAVDTSMRQSLGETRGTDYRSGEYLEPSEVASAVSFAFDMRTEVVVGEIDMRIHGT